MKKIDSNLSETQTTIEKSKFRRVTLKNIKFKRLNLKERLALKNPAVRKKFVGHLGKVAIACLSVTFLSSATAIDNSTIAINNEANKSALNETLKVMRYM